ncbi:MAG: ABC transporter ATP-binding protein [Abditibacteriales bacterium]|nr:ABC transporter ATP-binding protein [Abditibacteriales bacterium]MDW8364300.1 ABC transporter ATP-binding protein [Abditibacteriales bacterium]
MLEISRLDVYYGVIRALHSVSLHVGKGEIVTLIGANGAGKSTTLRTVSGLLRPLAGEILFEGEDITDMPPHRRVALGIVQVPEGRRVFPQMSVGENLDLGAYARKDKAGIKQDLERVFSLFPILAERRKQAAGTLSGGQQQMLAIGRALMARPRLLLMDEPSLGLAPLIVKDIFHVIAEIRKQGVTVLLVEQNAHMALSIADRGYVLETGRVTLSGPAKELMANEEVKKAYLGG